MSVIDERMNAIISKANPAIREKVQKLYDMSRTVIDGYSDELLNEYFANATLTDGQFVKNIDTARKGGFVDIG